jgi:hypothetical protein
VKQRDWGYSIGGPVGKPGGTNKLFFFYSQEFSPRTAGNNVIRYRMPTALERAGDFSQTLDNNGNLYPYIKDPLSTSPCSATNTAGCFQADGVLGKVPADRLYQPGVNILNLWNQDTVLTYQNSLSNVRVESAVLPVCNCVDGGGHIDYVKLIGSWNNGTAYDAIKSWLEPTASVKNRKNYSYGLANRFQGPRSVTFGFGLSF